MMKKMPSFVPQTVSARAIQRSYKQVVKQLNESDEPILVMNRNQPEFAMLSLDQLEEYRRWKAFDVVRRVQSRNEDVDPDEVMQLAVEEVKKVRAKLYKQKLSESGG